MRESYVQTIDSFDPDTVPTMAHILNELNAADVNSRVTGDEAAARTSLAPYVKFFNKFVKDLLLDEKAAEGNGAKGEDDDDDDDLDFWYHIAKLSWNRLETHMPTRPATSPDNGVFIDIADKPITMI